MSDTFLNQVALEIRPRGLGTSADYTNLSVNSSVSETHLLINSTTSGVFLSDTGLPGSLVGTNSNGNTYIINSSIPGNSMDNLTVEMWGRGLDSYFIELMDSTYYANQTDITLPHIGVGHSLEFQEVSGGTAYYRHRIAVSVGNLYDSFVLYGGAISDQTSDLIGFYIQVNQATQSVSFSTVTNNQFNTTYSLSFSLAGLPHSFNTPLHAVRLGKGGDNTCHVGNTRVTIGNRGPLTGRLLWGNGTILDEVVSESFNTTLEYKEGAVNIVDEVFTTTSEYKEGVVNRVDEVVDTTLEYKEGVVINARDSSISFNTPDPAFGKYLSLTDSSISFNTPDPTFGKVLFVTDASTTFQSFDGAYLPISITRATYSLTRNPINTAIVIAYIIPVDTHSYSYSSTSVTTNLSLQVSSQGFLYTGNTATYDIYTNSSFSATIVEQISSSDVFNFEFIESISESFEIVLSSLDDSSVSISETLTLSSNSSIEAQWIATIIDSIVSQDYSIENSSVLEGFTDTFYVEDGSGVLTPEVIIDEIIDVTLSIIEYTNLSGLQEEVIEGFIAASQLEQTANNLNEINEVARFLESSIVLHAAELTELLSTDAVTVDIHTHLERLLEKFTAYGDLYSSLSAVTSIEEYLNALDDFRIGYVSLIEEYVNTTDISDNILYIVNSFEESIDSSSEVLDSSTILIKVTEPINTTSTLDSSAIFNYLLSDSFKVVDINLRKGMVMSSYTYQPETTSVTTYSNYNFTSSARFHKDYLFANEDGLYLYGADTDNGVPITSTITTPAYDFGSSNLKSVSQAYLGLSTDNTIIMKVRVDGKAEVTYKLNKRTTNLQTLQIDIGKGLIGRYFQFEIITKANNFDLESIEFFPLDIGRKR